MRSIHFSLRYNVAEQVEYIVAEQAVASANILQWFFSGTHVPELHLNF